MVTGDLLAFPRELTELNCAGEPRGGCAAVVAAAEKQLGAAGAWTTSRHYAVPTGHLGRAVALYYGYYYYYYYYCYYYYRSSTLYQID